MVQCLDHIFVYITDISESQNQWIVSSTSPLIINKAEPQWKVTNNMKKEINYESLLSDTDAYEPLQDYETNRKRKLIKKQRRLLAADDDMPSCSYQTTCNTSPHSISSTSSSSTSSPFKSWHSSIKYPKNRLSLKRKIRKKIIMSSSDEDEDEDETQPCGEDAHKTGSQDDIKPDYLCHDSDTANTSFATHWTSQNDIVNVEEKEADKDNVMTCLEENIEDNNHLMHSEEITQ